MLRLFVGGLSALPPTEEYAYTDQSNPFEADTYVYGTW